MAVRVFLVEDQKPMRGLISDLLESVGGFEVVGTAATEMAATEWLHRHRGGCDLAILDLLLAEGSGFALIGRCQQHAAGAVLVFSDFVSPAVRDRCLRLGADGVISKEQFGALRAFLQDFPGRMREAQPA